MSDMYRLREQIKTGERKSRDLRNEQTKLDTEIFKYKEKIYSMPCDTVGWTDDELSSHIYHMHDSQGYIHVWSVPRKMLEQVHELVRGVRHAYRAERD